MKKILEGIKILDLTQVAAGPACTMFLGDLGAEVIKVEPLSGDIGRMLGPPFMNGQSVAHLSVNRNKKGIAINLKTPEGVNILLKMAQKCDVFVESFRPGVTDRLGIGYDVVKQINQNMIYCSISAYGQTGPWSHKPGVDGIVQGSSGLMSIIGEEEDSPPCKVQTPLVDLTTGLLGTLSILGALFVREKTNVGQRIDISMNNAALMLQQTSLSSFLASGVLPSKIGSAAPYAAPNEAVRTKDGYIMIAAYQPDKWSALCKLVKHEHLLDDSRFVDNPSRVANRKELLEILGKAFREKTSEEWLEILEQGEAIISGPIATYDQVVDSPQALHDKIFIEIEHPLAGKIKMPGFGAKFNQTPADIYLRPPMLGEHTKEILEHFSFGKEEISMFFKDKIVR
jgi:crotonobetainyl-CoA:carnitine CoA-transferase CaiB-like acyl-CoA transferase